jgi:LysR family transcriptional regulator, glycine cleavage system transcriptional activator
MPRIIPPLPALRAFEATSRLGRQSAAAAELSISASAVSHQIRVLEKFLGTALFHRTPGGPVLSPEGEAYFRRVSGALDILSDATQERLAQTDNSPLQIHMFQSLANLWFVPQLQEFLKRNPDQRVNVQTIPEHVTLSGSNIDAMIVYARERPVGAMVDHLFDEVITPVCAPAYLVKRGPIHDVAEILQHKLIASAVYVDEWRVWADGVGLLIPPPRPHLFFDNRANVLEAAREGLGFALDRRPFGRLQRAKGVLVSPLNAACSTGWSYWLICNDNSHHVKSIRRLRAWILSVCQGFF